jgi:hypothetical protein
MSALAEDLPVFRQRIKRLFTGRDPALSIGVESNLQAFIGQGGPNMFMECIDHFDYWIPADLAII